MGVAFFFIVKEITVISGCGHGIIFQPDNIGIFVVGAVGHGDGNVPAFAVCGSAAAGFNFAADIDNIVSVTKVIQQFGDTVNAISFSDGREVDFNFRDGFFDLSNIRVEEQFVKAYGF